MAIHFRFTIGVLCALNAATRGSRCTKDSKLTNTQGIDPIRVLRTLPVVAEPLLMLDTSRILRIPTRQTKVMLLLITLAVATFLYIKDDKQGRTARSLRHHPMANWNDVWPADRKEASVSCRVPRFHPFDKGILEYYRPPPSEIMCKEREVPLSLMHLDSGELQIFPGASFYKCYVEDLLRHGDNDFRFGNSRSVSAGRHRLEPADNVQAIRVFCRNIIGLTIYSHIHLVPPRVSLTPAVVIEKPHTKQDEVSQQRTQNVFIFGVDSVSRLAALRLLPFTYKYLVENMSAVVLRSHHKVGDNTFPNIITILSGDRRVHPADTPDMKQDYFDDWPLIWKRFSKEGYETLYAEDFPQFSTFNYLANGFSRPPTHHYLRPFWLAIEYSMLSKTSSLLCYGAKPKYQLQLDYIKYFLRKKRTNPYFAFSFLVEISHEYQEYVGAADRDFVEVLKLLKGEVLSGRTLLIVLSDHGHRFDSIRRTRQGHIEERLPFVAIATANTKHKAMLRLNSNMLTSHYDLHEVLRSLLPARSRPEVSKFGIDILQNVVPRNRTCAQAGVTEVHCTCVDPSNSQGEIDGTNIKALGTKAVKFVNEMLRQDDISRSVCKTLSLRNIRSSFSVGQKKVLTLITSPGGAIFELRIDHWNESLSEAMFSRINRYGTPCVPSQILRKYCYCG